MADNTQTALSYFQSQGWSAAQAAGIVANLNTESGLDPSATGDSGMAYGIGQWHPDRQARFLMYSGKTIQGSSLQDQLGFVNYELKTNGYEAAAGTKLAATDDPAQAAAVVAQYYERPASSDYTARMNAATALYNQSGTGGTILDRIKQAASSGTPFSWDSLGMILSGPTGIATGVITGAVSSGSSAVDGWMTSLQNWIKPHLIAFGVGAIAAILIAISVWSMVSSTSVGTAVKTTAKAAAFA